MKTSSNDNLIFHYTSLDALYNIIKGNSINFRVNRIDCMNDPNEYTFSNEMLRKCVEEGKLNVQIPESVENTYILSFSRTGDNPIMWRLYKANVCLAINKTVIEESIIDECNNLRFISGDVHYSNNKVEDFIETFNKCRESLSFHCENDYGKTENNNIILHFIKHKDYDVENEYRLLITQEILSSFTEGEFIDVDIIDKNGGLHANGMNTLYHKFISFPLSCLDHIIVHSNDKEYSVIEQNINIWLKHNNCKVEVRRTKNADVRY